MLNPSNPKLLHFANAGCHRYVGTPAALSSDRRISSTPHPCADLTMLHLNGIEAARQIRRRYPGIKILLLTMPVALYLRVSPRSTPSSVKKRSGRKAQEPVSQLPFWPGATAVCIRRAVHCLWCQLGAALGWRLPIQAENGTKCPAGF